MPAVEVVERYVAALPGDTRRLAYGEWGITVRPEHAAGWPLDVGLRIAEGLLRAQAFVAPAEAVVDPWLLLNWNRQTRFIRFAATRSGDLWIHADLAVPDVDERSLDRLLGLVVQGAIAVREYVAAARAADPLGSPG